MNCRFRLQSDQDSLEIVHAATLLSLCNSPRCTNWKLAEDPDDPLRLVLLIEWMGDAEHEVFRGSPECAEFFRALGGHVRQLEEAEYRPNAALLRAGLGGAEGMQQLVSDVLHQVSSHPLLGARFRCPGGEQIARLGWWLLEVLGGPKLYSLTVPEQPLRSGPLPQAPLDVEERAQLLEIVRQALLVPGGPLRSALSALEANLPLYPALPSGPQPLTIH